MGRAWVLQIFWFALKFIFTIYRLGILLSLPKAFGYILKNNHITRFSKKTNFLCLPFSAMAALQAYSPNMNSSLEYIPSNSSSIPRTIKWTQNQFFPDQKLSHLDNGDFFISQVEGSRWLWNIKGGDLRNHILCL